MAGDRSALTAGLSERSWAAARLAVLALPAVLALIQLGRLQVLGTDRQLLVGVTALALCLPPHLWHLWWGLQGRRPRGAGWTLAVMAAVNLVALLLAGPILIYLVALLATSAVVVLPIRWAGLTLAFCTASAVAALTLPAATSLRQTDFGPSWYVAYVVVFQTVLLSSLVWLVAAAHQLQATRSALVAAEADRERAGLAAGVTATLAARLDAILAAATAARWTPTPHAIETVVNLATTTLDRLRETVADARSPRRATEPAEQPASGPVADYLVSHRARTVAVTLYGVVLAFPLIKTLVSLGSDSAAQSAGAVVLWLLAAVPLALIARRHALGSTVPVPGSRFLAGVALLLMIAVWLVGVAIAGDVWNQMAWLPATAAVLLLPWRWGVAVALLVIGGSTTVDLLGLPPGSVWDVLVWGSYLVSISVEVVAALVASSSLVLLVDQLADTRRRLADHAADEQRWQLTSAVHDVLGQSLTAICLKGDLAGRLLDSDPVRAGTELDELAELASRQVEQLTAVLGGQPAGTEPHGLQHTMRRLREAGIAVYVQEPSSTQGPRPDLPEAFDWVLREATTNVLRHSNARSVSIVLDRDHGIDRLTIRNDGVESDHRRAGAPAMGHGLRGLVRRVESVGGHLDARAVEPDGYQLTVFVPVASVVASKA